MSSSCSTSSQQLPTEMRRLVVKSPGNGTRVEDCTVEVETLPVPTPEAGEVLIKVVAAPVNPSDYGSWYRGSNKLGKDAYPMAMGKEGCGIVVATNGIWAGLRYPIGTKVGFVVLEGKQGSYSEFVTVDAMKGVFPMPDDVPIEDCASFFVNPYTAYGILETARRECDAKVIVHTAAASQVGQMLNKLAPSEGMEILNVVRREEQAELLRSIGAKHIVVTSGDVQTWKDELKTKIKELNVTCAFDAVSGNMGGTLMEVLPPKSTVYTYGGLAGPIGNINPIDLIYRKKQLKGWYLTSWVSSGGPLHILPRLYAAGNKVNAGLNGGWSSSQFQDTKLESTFDNIVSLLGSSATGKKLRIRFDEQNANDK